MRQKLTLKDVKFVPKKSALPDLVQAIDDRLTQLASPSEVPVPRTAKSIKDMPRAIWVEMGANYLRVVLDQRLHMERRIYRIELFDKLREKRLAVFRRATEQTR